MPETFVEDVGRGTALKKQDQMPVATASQRTELTGHEIADLIARLPQSLNVLLDI